MDDLRAIIEGFGPITTASVADAVDRVVRRPHYMTHEIKPIFPSRIVGPAVTVLERAALESAPPTHALEAIDTAPSGAVIVIGTEDADASRNVATWGGLMTTAAVVRRLGAAVLNAGVRDVEEIRQAGFPVFSRTVIPSTSVGRYVSVARDIPVPCGGVLVHPGDIIVGDADGVVVVPRAAAAEVLKVAAEIEETERRMAEAIRESGSILKAMARFARI